jgi:hypothetical protein
MHGGGEVSFLRCSEEEITAGRFQKRSPARDRRRRTPKESREDKAYNTTPPSPPASMHGGGEGLKVRAANRSRPGIPVVEAAAGIIAEHFLGG